MHDEDIQKFTPLPEKTSPKCKKIDLLAVPDDEPDNVEPLFKPQRKSEPEIEVQQLA